jgi:site-specific recombinase XerD
MTGNAWAGIIGAWLAEVQQRTGSARTPVEYGRYVTHFARRLDALGRPLAEATAADAHAFAYAPLPDRRRGGDPGKAPGPSSVNVRLAALRSLYDFARRIGAVSTNPADGVKRPQLPQATPKGLTPAQTRELLAQAPQTLSGQRDRAIILAAVLTGLRREELIGLTASAIGLGDDGTPMYTARTKGGKLRYRELPAPAWDAITAYLDADGRSLDTLDDDARIFPISSQTLYENLRRYGQTIGVEGLTVHTLRHTAAKLRRQAGASLEDVQTVLGHANIATTARYLARLEGAKDTGWQAAAALLQGEPHDIPEPPCLDTLMDVANPHGRITP